MRLTEIKLLLTLLSAIWQHGLASIQEHEDLAEEYNKYQESSQSFAQLVRSVGPGFRVKLIQNEKNSIVSNKGARSDIAMKTVEKDETAIKPFGLRSSSDVHRYVSAMHSFVYVWSPWSAWSECSKTCGGGVSSRKRSCRREYARVTLGSGIRTSYQKCTGDAVEYKSCSVQPCAVLVDNFKGNQCAAYNGRKIGGITVAKWIPYTGGSNQCELACLAEGKNFYYSFGKAADGITCSLNNGNTIEMGVCVNGRCSRIGCDGKINSGITVDMCGICGGNNSTCTKVAAVVFTDVPVSDSPVGGVVAPKQPPSQYGYNMVVRVPRHATHIKVVDNSSNYLAILDGKTKKYVFNGDWVIDWPGNYEAGGTDFKYNRQKDQSETVTADGPVEHEVTVMLLQRSKNPGVYYEYWIPKDTKNKKLLKHKPPPPIIIKESTTKRVQAKLKKTTPKTTTTTTTQPPGTTATLIQALPTAASLVRKSGARKMYYTFGNRTYQKFPTLKNRVLMPKKRKSRYGVLTNEINPDRWSATWVLQDKNWEEKLFKKERKTKAKKVKKVKKEEQYCSFSCRRKQSARKNFCKSDFGIKAKVLHYDVIQDEIRYEVEVLQSYKNTVPMLSREYIWAAGAKCFCPRLKIGKEYIMLGSADKTFRKNEARFYLSADSYVRPFNRVNLERILRLRRDEVRYCSKYKH